MDEEKEDRISSLPECLLLEIISRIKRKNTHGENERKLTQKRHYDDDYFNYIDKTLTQCPTNVNLNKFKLVIISTVQPTSHVYSLICHAINRNVQGVDLFISPRHSEVFSYDDELFFNNSCFMSMNIKQCVFNPPNGVIRWDNLKCLCIEYGKLVDDVIGKILSGSPCLENLELRQCYGVRQIDATSKSFKNLVLTDYFYSYNYKDYKTIKINAPCMLSLTITGELYLVKVLLLNVSSLVKADLCYQVPWHFANKLGRTVYDIEEELLSGLLSSLGHVNEIILGSTCSEVLSCLKAKGFQFSKDVTSGCDC